MNILRKTITVRLNVTLDEKLSSLSEFMGIPKTGLMLIAIHEYISNAYDLSSSTNEKDRIRSTLRIPNGVYKELEQASVNLSVSVNSLINSILDTYLKHNLLFMENFLRKQ